MENKIKIVLFFVGLFAENDGMNLEPNTTSLQFDLNSKHSMEMEKILEMEMEVNQPMGMDCMVYTNQVKVIMIEYKQNLFEMSFGCKLQVQSVTETLKSMVDEIVEKTLDDYLQSIEEKKLKIIEMKKYSYLQSVQKLHKKYEADIEELRINLTKILAEKRDLNVLTGICQNDLENTKKNLTNITQEILIKSNIVSFIRNGNFTFGRELFLKSNGVDLNTVITDVYNSNLNYAENLIEFLNSLSDDEQIIRGYRLLFDQMIKNGHVYSAPTTTIAYRVFVDFKNNKNNENLIYLREKLPQSLKNFFWNQIVVIQNVQLKTKSIHSYYYTQDNLRVIPAMWSTDTTDFYLAHYLYPISNGKYFHIKSKYQNLYLYAETNEFALDNNRRGIFYWRKANETKEAGRWQLEPIEGTQNFKIKNINFNEYLSVAEGIVTVNSFLKPFTLRSGKCEDDNCKWNFLKYTGK